MSFITFFDTETTNLPAKGQWDNPHHDNTPKIVELAAVTYTPDGKEVSTMNVIVKPNGWTISTEASEIHGISQERAMSEGVELDLAIRHFHYVLKNTSTLVAHNIRFDWLVLQRAYIDLDFFDRLPRPELFCTMLHMTNECKLPGRYGNYKWPTLQEAYQHTFNKTFDNAHSALADVRACAEIFFHYRKQ